MPIIGNTAQKIFKRFWNFCKLSQHTFVSFKYAATLKKFLFQIIQALHRIIRKIYFNWFSRHYNGALFTASVTKFCCFIFHFVFHFNFHFKQICVWHTLICAKEVFRLTNSQPHLVDNPQPFPLHCWCMVMWHQSSNLAILRPARHIFVYVCMHAAMLSQH